MTVSQRFLAQGVLPYIDDVADDAAVAAAPLHIQSGAPAPAPLPPEPLGQLAVAQRSEITFIESNVADLPTLLKGLAGDEVHVLDAGQDGLAQIAAILAGRSGIDAVHIVSHGATAAVNFGALTLDGANLGTHRAELDAIGRSLAPNGDILLYGCDVGQGSAGAALIDRLATITGADVAASSNLTGAAAPGGDWRLEVSSGHIESKPVVDAALAALYLHTLAISSATLGFNSNSNFSDSGGYNANQDVIYNVNGNAAYALKFDGATQGMIKFSGGNYLTSDAGSSSGETRITFSFVNGQVFTPNSLDVANYQTASAQPLVFRGYDGAGNVVGTVTTSTSSTVGGYITANFSGLTNIAKLTLTGNPAVNNGKLVNLVLDNFQISDIHPAGPAVTGVSASTVNGAYKVGDTLSITVTFDSAVFVTGTPQLTLATGGAGHTASYASGSGGATLTFSYTVQAGDTSADLDYASASALTLNGGTVTNAGGGNAVLTLAAPGAAGSLGASKNLVIDTTPPAAPSTPAMQAASDHGTSSSDAITNLTTPVITGTAEAGATVKLYDTDGTTLLGSAVATGGAWSITSAALGAGAHSLTARATDAAGNVGTASAALAVTIDTTAPTLAISSSAASLHAGQTATITFTFSEDPGNSFTWDGSSGDVVVTGGTLGAISGSGLTRTATFTPTASTNAGSAGITVAAGTYTDTAGNNGDAGTSPSLTFDTLAPAAPSTPLLAAASDSGSSNSDHVTNVTTPVFTGTAESGATVTLYDSNGTTVLGTAVATGGNWSITSGALGAGTHTITAKATDAAGNTGAASAAQAVTIDTTAPTLAITSSAASLHAGQTATITFTFSEDPGNTFTWDGASGDVAVTGGTLGAISGTGLTRTATFTPTASTNAGSAGITVAAGTYTDTAGNNGGAGASPALTFDTLAPAAPSAPLLAAASDSGSSNSDHVTSVTTPTLSGSAEANATVRLYDGDGVTLLGTTTADGGGNWTITSSALGAGSHTLSAKASDAAGNVSATSAGVTLNILTQVPTVSITSDTASLKIGETAHITFTFSSDPGASFAWDGSSGDVAVTGGTLSAIAGSGLTRTATFRPTNGVDGGTAGITVTAASYQDLAGNAGAAGAAPALHYDTLVAAPTGLGANAASDSGVSNTDGISNVATPVIAGHAEAGAAVRLYDTDGATLLGSTTADGSGNWSITSSMLSAGTHMLTAKQTDVAGNVSAASAAYAFTLDTAAPTAVALSATTLSLSGAGMGATLATFSAGDATAVHYALAVGDGSNDADNPRFSISGDSLVAAQTLSAGAYQFYLSAVDAAGNATLQAFTVNVVDAPAVTSIARAGGAPATVPAAGASVSYTVTFSQAVTGVDAGDFTLTTGGSAGGTIGAVSGSGDTYTVTVNGVHGDGALRLDLNASGTGIVNASSVAIIAGAYTAGQAYTLDHTVPAAPGAPAMSAGSDTGASHSDAITSVATPVFTGTAEANAIVTLYDSDGSTVLGSATADGAGNWSITSSALADGAHTLTVKQADAAGNVSAAGAALVVHIDTAAAAPGAPMLAAASDSGTAGDGLTNATTPTITGTAEANALVTLYDSDGVTVLGSATADGAGHWSIVASTLGEGVHALTAMQTDPAGNASAASAALALTVDVTPPAAPGAPMLAAASDSGTPGDGVTNVATPVVSGTAVPGAAIRLYDGATLLGTAVADGDGAWTITSTALSVGAHALTALAVDAAGNLSAASAPLTLTIEAPPDSGGGDGGGGNTSTVDGVPVTQQSVTLPGGGSGTQVSIPIVGAGRTDSSGPANVADIPLSSAAGATLLLAQVAPGFGLTASGGASAPAGDSLEHLIQAILAATPSHPAGDQAHLTGNGQGFLAALAASVPLLVETIVPVTSGTAPAAAGALTLTGTSSDTQHTALVIDTSHLAPGSAITLRAVDFAAVVGAANVSGNTQGQILTGDAASQQFTVDAGVRSALFSGGGADTLHWLSPQAQIPGPVIQANLLAAAATSHALAAAPDLATATILHGGLGDDTAAFNGAAADYTLDAHQGFIVVSDKADPATQAVVIDVEHLSFAGSSVDVDNRAALTSLAGLYQDALGRQADLLGFDFWGQAEASGVSLGQIAVGIIGSAESQARGQGFNGDAGHDVEMLYHAIFNRASDAPGLAFWVAALGAGQTLDQVADGFVHSVEMIGHNLAAVNWDFSVR
jgi:hypothetical protein